MTKPETRSKKRKEVVEAIVLRKEPVHIVTRVFNIPERTVFEWLSRYRSGGWHALIDERKSGRPRKLSSEDLRWVYEAVSMNNPLNFQFKFCLWTLATIRTMIERERNIKLSKSSIHRLLHNIGLSSQRPIYKSYKQDPQKIEKYLNTTYPEVVKHAKSIGAEIYFIDEAAVRSDSHHGATWGKIGDTPVVKDSGGRFGLKMISAVTARGDMRFSFIEDKMNSSKFIRFLKKLRKDAGCPIIVIADNARYHHSKETQAFIEKQTDSIVMAFLPAYSPEFNPDEQVWNHLKARLAKLPIIDKESMKKAILSIMHSIQKNIMLVKSFFKLTNTKYILN